MKFKPSSAMNFDLNLLFANEVDGCQLRKRQI